MYIRKYFINPNPRESANPISVLLWWWTIGIFKKGYKKVLRSKDLYDPLLTDKANYLGDRLETWWNIEVQKAKERRRQPRLLKAIIRTFLPEYFLLGCIHALNEFVVRLSTPALLGLFLQYFKSEMTITYKSALFYAIGISITVMLNAIIINQMNYGAYHLGGRIRIAFCSVIYRKALKLSKNALCKSSPGNVMNLMANDVNRFEIFSIFIHYMWTGPISALIIASILYDKVGYAGLIGIIPFIVAVTIQSYTNRLSSKFRLKSEIKTEERINLVDEIICGIQAIKMYAWEKPFCKLVELARRLELKIIRKNFYVSGSFMIFNLFTTRMAVYCTLITLILNRDGISAEKIFVLTSYFNVLSNSLSIMFVRGFAEISEIFHIIKRLQNFLTLDEVQAGNVSIDWSSSRVDDTINSDYGYNSFQLSRLDISNIKEVSNYDDEQSREWFINNFKKNRIDDDSLIHSDNVNYQNEKIWAVKLDSVTAKWDLNSSISTLNDIDLEVEKGKLYIIIGSIGSGKTSLLSTILGEMNLLEGNVKVKGNISYAAQESWIFGGTIRQNILFGQKFNKFRYRRVIKACALLDDFKKFPQGDQTVISERGSSLSAGQKVRINLARCVYKTVDVYLLDDPFNGVDTQISDHLFNDCIQKLLGSKTRILITHQLQYVKSADSIILLEEGKIYQYSDYQKLLEEHPQYEDLIIEKKIESKMPFKKSYVRRRYSSALRSKISRTSTMKSFDKQEEEDEENDDVTVISEIVEEPNHVVNGSLLMKYLKLGSNNVILLLMIFLFLLTQYMVSFNDYLISKLVTIEESREFYKDLPNRESNANRNSSIINETDILSVNHYITIYTLTIFFIIVIGISRSFVFWKVCSNCNQRLHDSAFGALIRTSMQFFDVNPNSKILNRFSKDVDVIDELLPKTLMDSCQSILTIAGTLLIICILNPIFLAPISLIVSSFCYLQKVYVKISRNIKRIEATLRASIFTHLNTTLHGLLTIRAYQAQDMFMRDFDKFQDAHTSSWFMLIASSSAFGFSLDTCCAVLTTFITFSFLLIKNDLTGSQIGLAITQTMALINIIHFGLLQSAEVINHLMAVDRLFEYTELSSETDLQKKNIFTNKIEKIKNTKETVIQTPENWPSSGKIVFRDVYMRYNDEDSPVLKSLNLAIQPGEKIGIVGKTGAGKSSLISALFKLAQLNGVIEIDDVNINTIDLEVLRKNISIIPQDPLLFSGTLRLNLDPFNEFSDKILWEILEEIELKDKIVTTGNVLDSKVYDQGTNFSVSQRRLICLARAILRNNKILILDEVTTNADPNADVLTQKIIQTKFNESTVLMIARRMNTIIDCDKILVMEMGNIVEYDHPHILLQDESSKFTSLMQETDQDMYQQQYIKANETYEVKHNNA